MTEDEIVEAVQNAGMRRSGSMATWTEQAKLAAAGNWEALASMQEQLTGGRRDD